MVRCRNALPPEEWVDAPTSNRTARDRRGRQPEHRPRRLYRAGPRRGRDGDRRPVRDGLRRQGRKPGRDGGAARAPMSMVGALGDDVIRGHDAREPRGAGVDATTWRGSRARAEWRRSGSRPDRTNRIIVVPGANRTSRRWSYTPPRLSGAGEDRCRRRRARDPAGSYRGGVPEAARARCGDDPESGTAAPLDPARPPRAATDWLISNEAEFAGPRRGPRRESPSDDATTRCPPGAGAAWWSPLGRAARPS